MKLSLKQLQILSYAEHRPKALGPEIAAALKMKTPTVQSLLRDMRERWPASRKALINPMRVGNLEFSFYFSLATQSQAKRGKIIAKLCTFPQVIWLGSLVGEFQFGSVIAVKRMGEIKTLLEAVTNEFGEIFAAKSISPRVHFTKFPRKYLGPAALRAPQFELGESESIVQLDATDIKILSFLAHGELTSERGIARASGLPFATVERHINALENKGVIVGYYWDLPAEDLGRSACQLLLECGGPSSTLTSEIRKFCLRHPAITFLTECLGPVDFEIGAEVTGPRELGQLIDDLQELFATTLRRICTLTEIEDRKLLHFAKGQGEA